jgi:hypothetical protein
MAKRDVGMAGSSGYNSEFYTTTPSGRVVPNKRTMDLQGMNPRTRIADSRAAEERVRARGRVGLPMTDRDKARMTAVGGSTKGLFGTVDTPEVYSEDRLRLKIAQDDQQNRSDAFQLGADARQTIRQQSRLGAVQQKFGDNSFKPYSPTMPTLSKQINNANAKRK